MVSTTGTADDRLGVGEGVDHPLEDIGRHERTRGVVDEDLLGARDAGQPGPHRIVACGAAGDDVDGLAGECHSHVIELPRRDDHDDLRDPFHAAGSVQTMLQKGAAAHLHQRLGHTGRQPTAAARSHEDHRGHGWASFANTSRPWLVVVTEVTCTPTVSPIR